MSSGAVAQIGAGIHGIMALVAAVLSVWIWRHRGGGLTALLTALSVSVTVWNVAAVAFLVGGQWAVVFKATERFLAGIVGAWVLLFTYRYMNIGSEAGVGSVMKALIVGGLCGGAALVSIDPSMIGSGMEAPLTLGGKIVATAIPSLLFTLAAIKFAPKISHRDEGWERVSVLVFLLFATVGGEIVALFNLLPPPDLEYGAAVSVLFTAAAVRTVFAEGMMLTTPFSREDILDSVGAGVVVVDDNLHVTEYDATAAEIVPEVRGAFGEHIMDVLPDTVEATDADRFSGTVDAAVGGEDRSFVIESSPIAADDVRLGHVIVFRDVTEVEQYAADLERQTEQLDEFASVVSHDLRNPMNIANIRIDLAMEAADDNAEDLQVAAEALDRMETIIDDALTLAREGQAIDPEEVQSVGITRIVKEAWETVDTKNARLESRLGGDVYVSCDPSRVRSLFENLFRNAIEHGGDDVTVRVRAVGDKIIVEDDGPGIPDGVETAELFEKGVSSDEDGTGLGLSIVESIAKAHGWSVHADNSERGGAKFEICGIDIG